MEVPGTKLKEQRAMQIRAIKKRQRQLRLNQQTQTPTQ
jgi:hypothetical protein